MSRIPLFGAALAVAASLAFPTLANDAIRIEDAYFRMATPMAPNGAAFMIIHNDADTDDRLIDARSPIAKRVELHTHIDMGEGVMKMTHDEDGFEIPAHGSRALARGGDHVMFMGLIERPGDGESIPLTLVFEKAGEIVLEVPVDLERADGMGHGGHGHGAGGMGHGEGGMGHGEGGMSHGHGN